jgi:hypothetical protein
MGAWGPGTFEDDVANDWLEDLCDSDPLAFFRECLDLDGQTDYVEYVACVGVICSAEMIHGLVHGPRDGLPEAALGWLRENQTLSVGSLLPHAIEGMQRVLGPHSEMREMWEDEAEICPLWTATADDLLMRLSAINLFNPQD